MRFGLNNQGMVDTFAAQFESDGKGGYLYRRYGRGAAIRVSAAERDSFVATFGRQSRWWFVGLAVATVAGIIALALIGAALHFGEVAQYVSIGAMISVFVTAILVLTFRAYDVPRQALTGRKSTGADRSHEEAREIARARQSWGQILGVFVTFVIAFAAQTLRYDVLHGWGRLWLLFLVFGVMACGYAAIRKLQTQVG